MKKIILILLFIILSSFVYAEVWKDNCKIKCNGNTCETVLGKTEWVKDIDGNCKEIKEASSLKKSSIKCVVISDGEHLAECVDYNATHRYIKRSMSALSLKDKKSIPIKIMKNELNKISGKLELVEKSRNIDDLTFQKEGWIRADFDDEIHIGEDSTTITLQIADTENLGDAHVWNLSKDLNQGTATNMNIQRDSNQNDILIVFNTSSYSEDVGVVINNAMLELNLLNNLDDGTEGFNVSTYHIFYNFSWNEDTVTWNLKPNVSSGYNSTRSDSIRFFGGAGEPTQWQKWNVTPIARDGIGFPNISIYLNPHDTFGSPSFDSLTVRAKEVGVDSLRPILRVTFFVPDIIAPTITVTSPEAKTYSIFENNITIDFTAEDNVGGDGLDSLWYFNGTDNTSYTDGTTQYLLLDNGDYNFIFYANDTAGNLANETVSFTVAYDIERTLQKWRNTVTQQDVMYVNSTGDIKIGYQIVFANLEEIHNTVDGWITVVGGLNVTENITAKNVFLPQYIFSHTNATMPILQGAGTLGNWTNISFGQEDTDVKQGITHTYNDATNHTFTIMEDGIYNVDYDLDVEDTSVGASDIDTAARMILTNGSEVIGSVFETDITKQGAETELSHNFLVACNAGDVLVFQFIASDEDVQISTHGQYGEYPESATILMQKIANLP